MAKQLLVSLLVEHLGPYVEGLSEQNLKIGVWSGKVELQNLKVKPDVLNQLNLPVSILHGSIGKLKLKIPWGSLDRKPVKVYVDGLYVVVAPVDIANMSNDEVKRKAAADKRDKLNNAELTILKSGVATDDTDSKVKGTYIPNFVATILDNLEIHVMNVHVRYEDMLTVRGLTFSTGVTLATLDLSTADSAWNECFVPRNKTVVNSVVRKLGRVTNAALYWNTESQSCSNMSADDREKWLSSLIYTDDSGASDPGLTGLVYLLPPPNKLGVRLTHSEKPVDHQALVDCALSLPDLSLILDRGQYQQMMALSLGFQRLARQKYMALYRPTRRPKQDPKGWWKYAYVLVTGKEFTGGTRVETMAQGFVYKNRYITLVKETRKASLEVSDKISKAMEVEAKLREHEMQSIENQLPVQTLMRYRQIAAFQMRREMEQKRADLHKKNNSFKNGEQEKEKAKKPKGDTAANGSTRSGIFSFFSWVSGSTNSGSSSVSSPTSPSFVDSSRYLTTQMQTPLPQQEEDMYLQSDFGRFEEDLPIDSLVSQLDDAVKRAESQAQSLDITSFRLSLTCNATIRLTTDNSPLVKLLVALKAAVDTKASSTVLSFSVDKFVLIDEYTIKPISPYLIVARSIRERALRLPVLKSKSDISSDELFESQLSVIMQLLANGSMSLRVTAAPVDVMWNDTCLIKVLAFMLSSSDSESLVSDPQVLASMRKFSTQAALPQAQLDMTIEIDAPKIIIPEDCYVAERGGVLLDCGVLCMRGLSSQEGMTLSITLSAIHLGIPNSLARYATDTTSAQPIAISALLIPDTTYLIKPFSISIDIQNLDHNLADTTMAITLTDVRAELDVPKILRIIKVLNIIIQCFAAAAEEGRLNVLSMSEATASDVVLWSQLSSSDGALTNEIDMLTGNRKAPTVVLVGIIVTLPSVSVALSVSPCQRITLLVSYMEIVIKQRANDSELEFRVRAVSLESTRRASTQSFVAWTDIDPVALKDGGASVLGNTTPLVQFGYRSILNRQSPCFAGYATELTLDFSTLNLSLDVDFLLGMAPFAKSMADGLQELQIETARLTELASAEISRQASKLRAALSAQVHTTVIQRVTGIRLNATVRSVSLTLLRRPRKVSSPTISKIDINSLTLPELEEAFRMEIAGLAMETLVQENTDLRLQLRNFSLRDCRPSTNSYVHRELLYQSDLASEFSSATKQVDRTAKSSEEVASLLYLVYKLEGREQTFQTIDITVRDVTAFVYTDSIMDLTNIVADDIAAAVELSSCFQTPVQSKSVLRHSSPENIRESPRLNVKRIVEPVKTPAELSTECLTVRVAVSNPRVFVLENPMRSDSKAIVFTCDVVVTYSREIEDAAELSTLEIIQASLQSAELFVLLGGLQAGRPQQILEPSGVEVHISRRAEKNTLLQCTMHLDIREVLCKLALSDLKLINKIVKRVERVTKQNLQESVEEKRQWNSVNSNEQLSEKTKTVDVAMYELTANIGSFTAVAINDYYGQTLPVLRLSLSDLQLQGSGIPAVGEINVEGTVVISMEYFNAPVTTWEPVLERCMPKLTFSSASRNNVTAQIRCDEGTVQITASGGCVREVSTATRLVTQIRKGEKVVVRAEKPILAFKSLLGIPVEIYVSSTKQLVCTLVDDTPMPFPLDEFLGPQSRGLHDPMSALPSIYDLRVLGGLENERQPILALPLNTSHVRRCQLQAVYNPTSATPKVAAAPIAEELFENERYKIFGASWTTPFLPGDPPRWTDVEGRPVPSPQQFTLGTRWEWLEPKWSVDKSGIIGKEIDTEGWHYAVVSFSELNQRQHTRRGQKPMDAIRRRKWTRLRAIKVDPMASATEEPLLPLSVFWDPHVDPSSGTRTVTIRSGLQIKNAMGFPIRLLLSGLISNSRRGNVSKGKDCAEFTVAPGDTWAAPLLTSHASSIRVSPAAELSFGWSELINCAWQSVRVGSSETDVHQIVCSSSGAPDICIQLVLRRSDGGLRIICAPYCVIYNLLPCTLQYRCLYSGNIVTIGQQGSLEAGEKDMFTSLDVSRRPSLAVSVSGRFDWSQPILLANGPLGSSGSRQRHTIDLPTTDQPSDDWLTLCLLAQVSESAVGVPILEIFVYSRFALINRSGETLALRSKRIVGFDGKLDDAPSISILERRTYGKANARDAHTSWAEGSNNVALFHTDDSIVQLGLHSRDWSDELTLPKMGAPKTQFEILDREEVYSYQLAFALAPLPGVFRLTKALTVMPGFTLVNATNETIRVLQTSLGPNARTDGVTEVDPQCSRSWHKVQSSKDCRVRLRTASTDWSLGTADLNEIGTTVLLLPRKQYTNTTAGDSGGLFVAHVEAKLSEPEEFSYVTIVVWCAEESIQSVTALNDVSYRKEVNHNSVVTSALSVQNLTNIPITLLQAGIDFENLGLETERFELAVQPDSWRSFGWADPSVGQVLRVAVGASVNTANTTHVLVDMSRVGNRVELEDPQFFSGLKIELCVLASSCGKVLRAKQISDTWRSTGSSKSDDHTTPTTLAYSAEDTYAHQTEDESSGNASILLLQIHLTSLGISLVADRPVRREFVSLYLDGLEVRLSQQSVRTLEAGAKGTAIYDGTSSYLNVKVIDAQIDNYCETALFPVLLHTFTEKERKKLAKRAMKSRREGTIGTGDGNEKDDVSFLLLTVVRSVPRGSKTAIYEYVAARMLEIQVSVDSATLQLFLLDLYSDLIASLETADETLAAHQPVVWAQQFNNRTVVPEGLIHTVDVQRAKKAAQSSKMYIESLVLHPIKVRLTYEHTPLPRAKTEDALLAPEYLWLKLVRDMVKLEDVPLRLHSFIVSAALESPSSLLRRLTESYARDVQRHLHIIASNLFGSLRIIGKPVGLFRNIGNGARDFVYEPYDGLMQSPERFVIGLGKGTKSLVQNFVGGTLSGGVSIVEEIVRTVARSGSLMTGDEEYSKWAAEKRQKNSNSRQGAVDGLLAGSESILTGIGSGISGLVTKPAEEARKSGALGFVKGLGLGITGAVVKPVVGIMDGVSNVAHGISNQLSPDTYVTSQVRPRRPLERSPLDIEALVLGPLDLCACVANEYLQRMSPSDRFIAAIPVESSKPGPSGQSILQFNNKTSSRVVLLSDNALHILLMEDALENHPVLELRYSYGDLSHCVFHGDVPVVELVMYKTRSVLGTVPIVCDSSKIAMRLYRALWSVRTNMGNPWSTVSPDVIVGSKSSISRLTSPVQSISATDVQGHVHIPSPLSPASRYSTVTPIDNNDSQTLGFGDYTFGTANRLASAINSPGSMSEERLLQRYTGIFSRIKTSVFSDSDYLQVLDENLWNLICEWRASHGPLHGSRCCAILILNVSLEPLQLLRMDVIEGRALKIIPVGEGVFDTEARTLREKDGAVLLFAYGFRPSIVDPAHVKLRVQASAFQGQFSTRRDRTHADSATGAQRAGFLEKSLSENWAKYVLLIR